MKKDILGQKELDDLKLNWNFGVPGLMSTKCCGTGTCDYRPEPGRLVKLLQGHMILFKPNNSKLDEIKKSYGYLRK